jgi:hypothetical protein
MSTLVHSIRRRALVVGLVVASLAASGSAYAASAAPQLSNRPLPIKITGVVDGSLYGYANSYTPTPKFHAAAQLSNRPVPTTITRVVDGSLYGYANSYTPLPTKITGLVDGSLYGYANSYTPTPKFRKVPKIPQRPKVVVERTVVRCDVPVGTAHADDLWRCE